MSTRQIAFLHTSPAHVETFERLARACDPGVSIRHVVREDLLADAKRLGADEPGVVERVHAAMDDAASEGAGVVVCTCSTVGGAAEGAPAGGRYLPQRIDRAMADRAAREGPRILVVVALESTIEPTQALLRESAAAMGSGVLLDVLHVRDAWRHFESGDKAAYLQTIADAVRRAASRADVVVLAQASMYGALDLLADLPVAVLASPRLGVEHALVQLQDRG